MCVIFHSWFSWKSISHNLEATWMKSCLLMSNIQSGELFNLETNQRGLLTLGSRLQIFMSSPLESEIWIYRRRRVIWFHFSSSLPWINMQTTTVGLALKWNMPWILFREGKELDIFLHKKSISIDILLKSVMNSRWWIQLYEGHLFYPFTDAVVLLLFCILEYWNTKILKTWFVRLCWIGLSWIRSGWIRLDQDKLKKSKPKEKSKPTFSFGSELICRENSGSDVGKNILGKFKKKQTS